jgi:hypothetical protein
VNGTPDGRWSRLTQHLALGLEPVDAPRRARIAHALEVAFDGAPLAPPRSRRDPSLPAWTPQDVRERVARTDSCRHVLRWRASLGPAVDLRILDLSRRFVPRRLSIALPAAPVMGRICRPALLPGAAYDVPAGSVGVRGRVTLGADGPPVRWVRAVARRPGGGAVVGCAHGDDRGEFLLLLDAGAAAGADLILPIAVEVTVFGPDPPSTEADPADPYADLPLEATALPADPGELLRPGADAVLDGTELPGGYGPLAGPVDVECGLDGLVSVEFVLS